MRIALLLLVLSLSYQLSIAQGCSDAGFCTMGAMKPDQPYNKKIPIRLRSMEVSFYRGTTTLSPIVYVATADMNFSVFDSKTSFQLKVPFQAVNGNFAATRSLADLSLCLTRNVASNDRFDVNISLGAKIPSNDANLKENGHPLPMYYQTSLGTYDLIAGVSVISKKWLFATGIQRPIININNNQFTWAEWIPIYKNGGDEKYVRSYNACNQLSRGTDVMLRVERNFRFSRLNFSVGLLPIYRITRDEVYNVTLGERIKPDKAHGLAMSAIGTVGYNFDVRTGIKLLVGHKLVQRHENPDGLTRELVTSVSYYYRF